jgi:acyl-coenzyme A thioesterase PaaI-like protein
VSYLAGALGEDIFAEAQVQRRGKALIYSDVSVSNADGKTLARGLHIYRFEDGA